MPASHEEAHLSIFTSLEVYNYRIRRYSTLEYVNPFIYEQKGTLRGSNPLTHLKSIWIYQAEQPTRCFSLCCHDSTFDSTLKTLSMSLVELSEQSHLQMSTRMTPKYVSEQY